MASHRNGTKTKNAERLIPLLYPVVKPALTYRQFNRRLEKLRRRSALELVASALPVG